MILPIYVFGHDALRRETEPVTENTEAVQTLISNMIETMRAANGLGLAAPQVGRTERIFVVDLLPLADELHADGVEFPEQPMVFINPKITWESEATGKFEEGCLSIPDVREPVRRPERVQVEYLDRNFEEQSYEMGDMLARVVQHEYDHLEGVLFTDHLSAFRRRLLRRTLRQMANGDISAEYPLRTADGDTIPAAA
ncbi:peptide deformylase [Longimonas halophila]|uniref:Peptide deformylase n=1 Tax=Longimonas halophila TaxID=1469170 RepID=A0A2H3P748_9BACT|nr:peptide deformylase [Longimonas halophila]PEN06971.1 peptide deformylase [Longimonas halophila]